MSDEVREEIHAILMLLKGCLTKNEVSMAFDKKTEELLFSTRKDMSVTTGLMVLRLKWKN